MAKSPIVPAYFDSALVAKFYLNEPGRDVVRRLARDAGVVVTSGIAVAEVSTAFHRKFREGAVDKAVSCRGSSSTTWNTGSGSSSDQPRRCFSRSMPCFLRPDKAVFLRSLDALHLVTARAEHFDRIYSTDRHLLNASASVALKGVDPTSRI